MTFCRPALSTDYLAILDIARENGVEPKSLGELNSACSSQHVKIIVVEDDCVCGFAIVREVERSWFDLSNFAIKKNRQGNGLGTLLLNHLKSHLLIPYGTESIYTRVMDDGVAEFLLKNGFERATHPEIDRQTWEMRYCIPEYQPKNPPMNGE